MKTLKCPECDSPLKILNKKESFEGWRQCHKCNSLTHIIATSPDDYSVQSLNDMLDELKENKVGIQTLQFIMDSGTAEEKNIMFCVGKKSRTFLDLMVNVGVLEKEAKKYRVKKPFKDQIQDYIENKIRKKSYNRRNFQKHSRVSA